MDKYIGIDLGGSHLRINDVDSDGKFGKEREVIVTSLLNNATLEEILIRCIGEVAKRVMDKGNNIAGIGLGSPGPLNYKKGIIEMTPNLPNLENFPAVDILGSSFPKYPSFLVHDSDAALLGEQWLGAAKNFQNVAMFTFGTGLGSAILSGGRLIRGNGRAVEAGHTDIDVGERRLCSCGRYNHWEAFVNTDGLVRTHYKAFQLPFVHSSPEQRQNISVMFRGWLSHRVDSKWSIVLSQYCEHVVLGLRNIVCNFNPECIILGGGILTGNEELLEAIKKRWHEYMFENIKDNMVPLAEGVEIRLAKLSNAGVVGAAKYAMDQVKG